MSQQGGRPGGPTGDGPEDDWWGQLYDDAADDTGPAPAADSLDDRFASAAGAVGGDGAPAPSAPGPGDVPGTPVLPGQRRTPPPRAWWEPEPPTSPSPTTEPPNPPTAPLHPPAVSDAPTAPEAPSGPALPSGAGRSAGAPPAPDAPPAPPAASPPGRTPPTDVAAAPGPPSGSVSAPGSAPASPQGTGRPADSPSEPEPPVSPVSPAGPAPTYPPGPGRPAGSPPATEAPPAPVPPAAPPPPVTSPPGRTSPTDASAAPEASSGPVTASGPGGQDHPASAPEATRHAAVEPRRPDDGAAAHGVPTLPDRPPPSGPTAAPVYGDWTPAEPSGGEAEGASPVSRLGPIPPPLPSRVHVGTRPPTYDAEPTALPAADPDDLDALVPDTVLDGARYGACTLRAVSVRGDSARYRGEPRRDALLTARFGTGEGALVLVALATGTRTAPGAHLAAAEVCRWIAAAVGRSHERLTADIRAARRADLKAGLHRLTDRSLGRLRAAATEQGLDPDDYAATLRCLLLSGDPGCRTRVFFGVGPGGLFRLRDGEWQDIEPEVAEVKGEPVLGFGSAPHETPDGDRLTMDLGIPTPPSPYEPAPGPPREPFRFRTSVARSGDVLLMCATGFAEPLRGEPELRAHLADRWSGPEPPGLTAYLADTQVRVKGYADDRTAVAVWEA
ncbi:protein phosphatase 2C domain-containing protein [Streptomyces althioticus]|nr:protein phosphatase 2C domain-containing protein [Streptomyces althioticus]